MNKIPKYYYISYLWTLPWNLVAWFVVLIMRLAIGGKLFWLRGLWLALKEDSWFVHSPYKKWGGTTFGNGGILRDRNVGDLDEIDTPTEFHEHVHTEQFEVASLGAFISFGLCTILTGSAWFLIPMWFSGFPILLISGWLQALIRGESAYRGSQHEESAYAQEELWTNRTN